MPSTASSPSSSPLRAALALAVLALSAAAAQAEGVPGQGTWETSLAPRDLNGDGVADAYYDFAMQITWVANANIAGGPMSWDGAKAYAKQFRLGGLKGWRLPRMQDSGNPGCDFGFFDTDCGFNVRAHESELAYMFHVTLGNKSYYNVAGQPANPGWGLTNTGPFQNIQAGPYWFKTQYKPFPDVRAWEFDYNTGGQTWPEKTNLFNVWLVHNGDVGTPVPR
jgi:hypothetical protein